MSMRIQEVHPSIVHFPVALFPTAIGADALGRMTGNKSMSDAGKWGVALSAGAAALAAATGAVAQETAEIDGTPHDLLVAHRNLNLGFLGLASFMAAHRAGRSSPGLGYLAAGTAGIGLLVYSAYLGGHMVYEHGVAVKAAGTLKEEKAPELRPSEMRRVAYTTASNLIDGLRNTLSSLTKERLLPNWTNPRQGDSEDQSGPRR